MKQQADSNGVVLTRPAILPVISALPSNPVDGQEVFFLADAAAGVVWHLKYRVASGSAYKWEFVGGGPMYAQDTTGNNRQNTALNTWQFMAGSPSIVLPLAGQYEVEYGARLETTNPADQLFVGAHSAVAGVPQPVLMHQGGVAAASWAFQSSKYRDDVVGVSRAAGDNLRLVEQTAGAVANVAAAFGFLCVRPLRVG